MSRCAAAGVTGTGHSQTGVSLMRPASYCDVWPLKASWGLVSNEGCKACAPSLDTLGWFARSAQDLGLLLDVFDAQTPLACAPFTRASVRITLCRTPAGRCAESDTGQAFETGRLQSRAASALTSEWVLPAARSQYCPLPR